MAHGLHIIEAKAAACFKLTVVDGHDAGANDLCYIGTGIDTEYKTGYGDIINKHENDEYAKQQLHNNRRATNNGQIGFADKVQNA